MPDDDPLAGLVLWRAFVPRWAHDPLSGAGAALFGGRWNAQGVACLYAARELSTAWAEYNQGFVQHPATIVHLLLQEARLADLTLSDRLGAFSVTDSIHEVEGRDDLDSGRVPATHALADRLRRRL